MTFRLLSINFCNRLAVLLGWLLHIEVENFVIVLGNYICMYICMQLINWSLGLEFRNCEWSSHPKHSSHFHSSVSPAIDSGVALNEGDNNYL